MKQSRKEKIKLLIVTSLGITPCKCGCSIGTHSYISYMKLGSFHMCIYFSNVLIYYLYLLFLCVWMYCLHVCYCTHVIQCLWRSDPLELELQMVVSHHVKAGNWTQSSARAASALNCWAISPVSFFHLLFLFCF